MKGIVPCLCLVTRLGWRVLNQEQQSIKMLSMGEGWSQDDDMIDVVIVE